MLDDEGFSGTQLYTVMVREPVVVPDVLGQARAANATIVRTLVDWSKTAPTRPANAANSFDPAYRFSDIDELVRNAQQRGLEVVITIWGTPKWANGGKTPNNVPRNVNDLKNFSRAGSPSTLVDAGRSDSTK